MIWDAIVPKYIDGNRLVTPSAYVSGGNGQGSDNGPMYTSEFYFMLPNSTIYKSGFLSRIEPCIDPLGNLRRVPYPTPPLQSNRQTGPDDYLGVLNASKALGITSIPRTFLKAVIKNLGSLNNESPGKWSWRGFLVRQPQLVAAMVFAAFPNRWNPVHMFMRTLAFPFSAYSAAVIALSCRGKDKSDTDSRRLSWHLVQIMKDNSLLCWFASKLWYNRLYHDYGPIGMRAVAAIYYSPGHPFAEYWIN